MSSPIVESVRTIPLIIEKGNGQNHIPMDIDTSGFPFERDSDRDGHFRSQLDDIAKRHPELAEHLGTFSRRRQSSGGDAEDLRSRRNEDRRFERPFAGHFDRFGGFPFDRDSFDPEQYAQQFYQTQPEFQQPQPQHGYQQQQSYPPQSGYPQQQSYQPQYQPPPEYQQSQPQYPPEQNEAPSNSESGRNNIQQSNTIDLGQKQEPVNERNQRSMSAPPAEKAQRFTSSINIPVNQPSESDNMAQTQSPQDNKTTERIIPIHIEGRDEPVLPKTAPSAYPQPHQAFSTSGPQPERIFGQRPEHFTQFVNREPPRQYEKWHRPGFDQMHQGFSPEELLRQQRFPQQNVPPYYQQQRPAPPQQQPKEEIPIPVQKEVPQAKQQTPPQQAEPPQPPKPAPQQQQKPRTPIDQIQAIQKDVSELMGQVERFSGKPKDKQYLYLDEMLTRNLLKLDDVDTQGQDSIRSARKEAIKCIEKTISVLEAKAAGNVAEEKMEVEEKSQKATKEEGNQQPESEVQTMETEPAALTESKPEENQPQVMEFSPANQESVPSEEEKKDEEKTISEDVQADNQVVENRAVLVTTENKEPVTAEDKVEPMEAKEPSVAAEEPKPAEEAEPSELKPIDEQKPTETCESQESNLAVADAVKKFEGNVGENKTEGATEVQQEEKKAENETEGEKKTQKKKGKKKAEKKEK